MDRTLLLENTSKLGCHSHLKAIVKMRKVCHCEDIGHLTLMDPIKGMGDCGLLIEGVTAQIIVGV